MKTAHHPYSAFLRGPTSVLPDLESGDIVLERRDEVNLVLTSEPRAVARAEGMEVTGRLLAGFAEEQPQALAALMTKDLPWLRWLPDDERPQAIRELVGELVAGASTGLLDPFSSALRQWRETAMIWSDPKVAKRLSGHFPGDGPELLPPDGEPAS